MAIASDVATKPLTECRREGNNKYIIEKVIKSRIQKELMPISDDMPIIVIGRLLRIYRHARNLSQERLGYKVGLSYQQIQKYEAGKSHISLSMFLRLCHTLEIAPQDFLNELKRESSISSRTKNVSPSLSKIREDILSLIHGTPPRRLNLIHQILHLLLKKNG